METWWDDLLDWGAAMDGYKPFRRDRMKARMEKQWGSPVC